MLSGRGEMLAAVGDLLTRTAHFGGPASAPLVWTGVRGVGKTVTLLEARRLATERGFVTVHVTADRAPGLGERLARAIAEAVAEAELVRGGRWERFAERLSTFNLQVSVGGVVTVGTTGTQAPEPAGRGVDRDQLRRLIEDAADQATDGGRPGVLLTLDETQEAPVQDLVALVNTLQDLAGGSRPVVCVAAGLPSLPEKLMAAGSFAERFDYRRMRALTEDAALQALLEPADALEVRWTRESADAVLRVSRGAPYLLQLYADATWRFAGPVAGEVIGTEAAAAGVLEAERSLWDGQYRGRWNRASPAERALLVAIAVVADADAVASSRDISAHLGRSTPQLSPARASLIDKGLIEAHGHGYLVFTVPGFERFVLAQAHQEESVTDPRGHPRVGAAHRRELPDGPPD